MTNHLWRPDLSILDAHATGILHQFMWSQVFTVALGGPERGCPAPVRYSEACKSESSGKS